MWVEYAGEIWPVSDALIVDVLQGTAGIGQLPGIPEGPPTGWRPGGGYATPDRTIVFPGGKTGPPVSVAPGPTVPRGFPTFPPPRRPAPRYARKYVCEWRTVRVPASEPPRTVWAD